ncbi:DUF1178 family protein [Jhaorihella thermophila]|uniref:DUF1178 family protein n=1 Tax=Jhaorihella thermophila TaxID=488547 RepID=A0A1H5YXZ7_9RHOB|nr:DUF1178 family protein [Jhaorihella thermophila]SEG28722.1 hypothetical protein SAMN05421751_12425 [Jhaorihella thermophila]
MIQYALKCADGHSFDSWFQSSDAFDKLHAAGMVACAVCGSTEVEKSVMAPRVQASRDKAKAQPDAPSRPLSEPASPAEQALAELRRRIEANSDYVGRNFAAEARAIHDGEAPARSIYGEARPDEAKALIEDGIPVAPLPFRPQRKSN